MKTPAVYDLQTEKLAWPDSAEFTVGSEESAEISLPIGRPWGNRGGSRNIDSLLESVGDVHAKIDISGSSARVVPVHSTDAIYVDSRPVDHEGTLIRTGETVVLGNGKSDLWQGYRVQVFF